MNSSAIVSLSIFLLVGAATAAKFTVRNNCPYTVWAAGIPVGGGKRLDNGQTWEFDAPAGIQGARIWGRTGCSPDGANCQTGDCAGALECRLSGKTPATLAEYTLNGGTNKDQDFIDISLVDGFNLKMEFGPNGGNCRGIKCAADINEQCPAQLKVPGGCNNRREFADFFKKLCPDAYSYDFDDKTSTFTCPAGTNYQVVFCP